MCAYQALLEPGDTVLGLSLDHGGHLTHGSPVNASGKLYHFVPYKVTPGDERIDMDQVRDLALEHRPKMIVAGTTSYPRRIDPEPFRAIADEVGALFLFDAAHIAGLIAGGAHPNPVPYADIVTFTTHKTLRGPRGGCILSAAPSTPRPIDKAVFPGWQGGPLEHVIAGKAVAFCEAPQPELRRLRPADRDATPARWPRRSPAQGFRLVSGGTDNHMMVVDLRAVRRRAHRQGGPDRARPGRHHAEQEHHPGRPAQPVRHQRPAHRHAVGHDPGDGGGGDGRRSPSSIALVLRKRDDAGGEPQHTGRRRRARAPGSRSTPERMSDAGDGAAEAPAAPYASVRWSRLAYGAARRGPRGARAGTWRASARSRELVYLDGRRRRRRRLLRQHRRAAAAARSPRRSRWC